MAYEVQSSPSPRDRELGKTRFLIEFAATILSSFFRSGFILERSVLLSYANEHA